MKEKIIKIIFLLSTIIGITVAISTVNDVVEENQEIAEIEDSISELKEVAVMSYEEGKEQTDEIVPLDEDENMNRKINWNELKQINTDIVAWLYIPNTNIDYPILQEQEVGAEYYLHHDYKGDYLRAGSIFTPKEPYEDIEDAHFLLFGHRMKDKTIMFSSIHNYYENEELMLEHQYAYVYTKEKTERYVIWCAVNAKSDDAIYTLPYALGSKEYEDLISYLSMKSYRIEGNEPTKNDRILVLSTCSGKAGGSDRFYLVFKIDKINSFIADGVGI